MEFEGADGDEGTEDCEALVVGIKNCSEFCELVGGRRNVECTSPDCMLARLD